MIVLMGFRHEIVETDQDEGREDSGRNDALDFHRADAGLSSLRRNAEPQVAENRDQNNS